MLGDPTANTPHLPVPELQGDPVDSIAALTLPVGAETRHRCRRPWRRSPARAVVTSVADLTLPYRDRDHAVQERSRHVMTRAEHWRWTGGRFLMLLGLLVLATLGGIWADAQAQIAAAQGDPDVPAPTVSTMQRSAPPTHTVTSTAAPALPSARFPIPILNRGSAAPTSDPGAVEPRTGPSTITRLVIPAIKLDRKVVEVGWTMEEIAGQAVAVWEVDRYRVGHHQGSGNPGGGSNIVLAGHSGGNAYPFNALFYVKPGDLIEVTSAGQLYQYTVSEQHLVDEVGQPLATRLEHARFMEPTDEEVITMIACWPLTGKAKFTQRVIVRALPIPVPSMTQDLSPIHPR